MVSVMPTWEIFTLGRLCNSPYSLSPPRDKMRTDMIQKTHTNTPICHPQWRQILTLKNSFLISTPRCVTTLTNSLSVSKYNKYVTTSKLWENGRKRWQMSSRGGNNTAADVDEGDLKKTRWGKKNSDNLFGAIRLNNGSALKGSQWHWNLCSGWTQHAV